MLTTQKVTMDLWKECPPHRLQASQDDCYTRAIEFTLLAGGDPWEIPEDAAVVIRYSKEDGKGGEYDTLPDGTTAWSIDGNRLTVLLAPQVLTVAGSVKLDAVLLRSEAVLSTCSVYIRVRGTVCASVTDSQLYRKVGAFLPMPASAEAGEAIVVKTVDAKGKPTAVETKPYSIAQETGDSATAVMSQRAVTDAIAKAAQSTPEFVNSISECTDTSKLYVLPSGYIYMYMRVSTEVNPNVFTPSTASLNTRLNTAGAEVASNGSYCTDYISVDLTAQDPYVVLLPYDFNASFGNQRAILYDANKTLIQNCYMRASDETELVSYVFEGSDGRCYLYLGYTGKDGVSTAPDSNIVANAKYVRFSILKNNTSTALTADDIAGEVINFEALRVLQNSYTWRNTGRAYQAADYEDRIIALERDAEEAAGEIEEAAARLSVLEEGIPGALPDYWKAHLSKKTAAIHALQESGGKDCFSFPVLTDIHISANLGKYSGLLARAAMDACDMPYALCLGDVVTRGANETAAEMDASFQAAEELLAPLRGRLLQTQGNHDGAWGAEDLDLDGDVEGNEYYCRNFTTQKLHRLIYRKAGLTGQVHFDETGTGYYMDDISSKVRYILLNSHCHPYEENADGTAKYNTMRLFRFRQAQYDLLVEALSTVPGDDWAVVTASHAPLNDDYASAFGGNAGDHVLMRGLLAAYKNKQSFTGSFAGTYGADAVSVSANFASARGQYIAHFAGHCHADTSGVYGGITVVTTRCDGHEENDETSTQYKERAAGTVTEQSFDIITVDRAARTIHATKIGAGDDRTIRY
ncbi:MAG: metallophosphoesterase [Oscillospiraceae bacterium]|nr:metallophosphoesterase [Oscillospiraceae bacterium]